MSNPPTFDLTVTGSAPNQYATEAQLESAINTALAALHETAVAAGARISAKAFTASVVGNDWTVTWSGARGIIADGNATVDDVTALSVPAGSAAVLTVADGTPYPVTVETIDSTLRNALEDGAKVLLLGNLTGAVFGLLADGARAAIESAARSASDTALAADITAEETARIAADAVLTAGVDALEQDRIAQALAMPAVQDARWLGGLADSAGAGAVLFDADGTVGLSALELWRGYRGAWVGGIADAGGRLMLGLTPQGAVGLMPALETVTALAWQAAGRAEPPFSAGQTISSTTASIGGETVNLHTITRMIPGGAITAQYAARSDIASSTRILHGSAPIQFIAANGQSNAVGGGGDVSDPQLWHDVARFPGNCLMFTGGARGRGGDTIPGADLADFVPLVEAYSAPRGETQLSGAAVWQQARARVRGEAPPVIVARSHGQAATSIEDLDDGSQPYVNGLAEITAAVAVAAEYGRDVECRAVFWDQGEADPAMSAATYQGLLEALIADYNTDWKAVTGQSADVQLYITQLAGSISEAGRAPTLGQYQAAQDDPLIHISAPNYLFEYADNVHKSARGHAHAGEYQMRAHLWQQETEDWTGLRPSAVSRSGAVIDITFDVPEGALEFATDRLPAAENCGFHFVDDSDSATIASVAITGADTVRITLTGTPSGANPRVSYAFVTPSRDLVGRSCAWGNLCSRSADPSIVYPGRTLDHYCQIFQEAV